jgi:hypothetical protein
VASAGRLAGPLGDVTSAAATVGALAIWTAALYLIAG